MSIKHSWLFDFVTMVAVVSGVIYGAIEVGNLREAREREAMIRLYEIGEAEAYVNAVTLVINLPDTLTAIQMNRIVKENETTIRYLWTTFEGLGVLVYRKQIPLPWVDELYGGPIMTTFRKLKPWIEYRRIETHRQSYNEWYQWLAERLAEYEKDGERTPAHIAHKDWKWDEE